MTVGSSRPRSGRRVGPRPCATGSLRPARTPTPRNIGLDVVSVESRGGTHCERTGLHAQFLRRSEQGVPSVTVAGGSGSDAMGRLARTVRLPPRRRLDGFVTLDMKPCKASAVVGFLRYHRLLADHANWAAATIAPRHSAGACCKSAARGCILQFLARVGRSRRVPEKSQGPLPRANALSDLAGEHECVNASTGTD